jgi:hypothetical protein
VRVRGDVAVLVAVGGVSNVAPHRRRRLLDTPEDPVPALHAFAPAASQTCARRGANYPRPDAAVGGGGAPFAARARAARSDLRGSRARVVPPGGSSAGTRGAARSGAAAGGGGAVAAAAAAGGGGGARPPAGGCCVAGGGNCCCYCWRADGVAVAACENKSVQ